MLYRRSGSYYSSTSLIWFDVALIRQSQRNSIANNNKLISTLSSAKDALGSHLLRQNTDVPRECECLPSSALLRDAPSFRGTRHLVVSAPSTGRNPRSTSIFSSSPSDNTLGITTSANSVPATRSSQKGNTPASSIQRRCAHFSPWTLSRTRLRFRAGIFHTVARIASTIPIHTSCGFRFSCTSLRCRAVEAAHHVTRTLRLQS